MEWSKKQTPTNARRADRQQRQQRARQAQAEQLKLPQAQAQTPRRRMKRGERRKARCQSTHRKVEECARGGGEEAQPQSKGRRGGGLRLGHRRRKRLMLGEERRKRKNSNSFIKTIYNKCGLNSIVLHLLLDAVAVCLLRPHAALTRCEPERVEESQHIPDVTDWTRPEPRLCGGGVRPRVRSPLRRQHRHPHTSGR